MVDELLGKILAMDH